MVSIMKWLYVVFVMHLSLHLYAAPATSALDNSFSNQYSDIYTAPLASQHLLESQVKFLQDNQGQIWLLSNQSISQFKDDKFLSFKLFNISEDVIDGQILGSNLYIITQTKIFQISLIDSASSINLIWQAGKDPFVKLLSYNNGLLLQTINSAYVFEQAQLTNLVAPSTLIARLPDVKHEIRIIEQGILLLQERQLSFYSSKLKTWDTEELIHNVVDVAEYFGHLIYLTKQGKVEVANPFHFSQTKDVDKSYLKQLHTGERFIKSGKDLYLKSAKNVYSLTAKQQSVVLPQASHNVFIDNNNNFWLSNLYDVQIAWFQPFWVSKSTTINTSEYDVYSSDGKYALKHNRLYQKQNNQSSTVWQYKVNFPQISDVSKIIETNRHIWFVSNKMLWSFEKQTLLPTLTLSLTDNDLVLPHNDNHILLVKFDQMLSLSAEGGQKQVMTLANCKLSCLPDYKVSKYLHDGDKLWLATNRGLHILNLTQFEFSSQRIDVLNGQAPVTNIVRYSDSHLWVSYPYKIALMDKVNFTSTLYFSPNNRVLDTQPQAGGRLTMNTQRGWFTLTDSKADSTQTGSIMSSELSIQQFNNQTDSLSFSQVLDELKLSSNDDELKLVFNLNKQHPAQNIYLRFKYEGDIDWTRVDAFQQVLTLKNLRQGSNQLQLQARLEGQLWQTTKTFTYDLPYKALQTKWLVFYGLLVALVILAVFLLERFKGLKIAFKSVKQQAFISSLLESTRDGVWIANKDREIKSINAAFSEITGYSAEDVKGKSFQIMTKKGRDHEVETLIWQEVVKSGFWAGEVWSLKEDGQAVSIDLSVTRVETENKMLSKTDVTFVGVFSDVTMRKQNEQDLRHLATRDTVTQLPNRTLFIEYINNAIDTSNPLNPNFSVVFIDLDNFKKVNESLGHLQGDELVKLVSQRISQTLDKGVLLARLGGDEFALLIPSILLSGEPSFYIKRTAGNIKRALQPAFSLMNTEINISASMGVAIYPQHGHSHELLMRCADTALNKIKRSGKNNYHIYNQKTDDSDCELLTLESELIYALDNDEFIVHYQPKYLIQENQVSGFEALVRWESPTRGLVPPDQFIEIAEENGLIRKLDSWVFKQVCRQVRQWQQLGVMVGKVAVNVSALNFQQLDFCQNIKQVLLDEKVSAEYIELEITETAMMKEPERALRNLHELRSAGFSIALDDFGTGHSSLGHIKTFPIDRLKIDRTFITDIETSEQDKNITSVIIQLAKYLNIAIIAEGVECEAQAYLLHVMGCNEIQGYFISKPMAAEHVATFLQGELQRVQVNSTVNN